jgi:ABC-type Zn uptake system ZnuABC Zn-binding protein ZnuA
MAVYLGAVNPPPRKTSMYSLSETEKNNPEFWLERWEDLLKFYVGELRKEKDPKWIAFYRNEAKQIKRKISKLKGY